MLPERGWRPDQNIGALDSELGREPRPSYSASAASSDTRWRLVAEFLKEYHREPPETRHRLLADAPGATGDEEEE